MSTCPKCGSSNITFQREQTASIGGSKHTLGGGISVKKGLIYWLLIGWWIWSFKAVFNLMIRCFTLGLVKIKKKDKITGRTVTASKAINHTVGVCQGCGHTWKV